jgi:hypothetical protein
VRPDQAQGRGRRCDAPRLYAHDSSGCRLALSAFGRSIFASRHFPSQTFCNCRCLSGAAPSPLRSIMARSDVGLLGTDLIPSGPFLCGQPLAKRAPRAEARWATRFVEAALLGPVALGDEKGEGARQRSVPIPDSLSNELAMLSNAREGEGVSLERALSGRLAQRRSARPGPYSKGLRKPISSTMKVSASSSVAKGFVSIFPSAENETRS